MSLAAGAMASQLEGLPWPLVYVALIVTYVLIHADEGGKTPIPSWLRQALDRGGARCLY